MDRLFLELFKAEIVLHDRLFSVAGLRMTIDNLNSSALCCLRKSGFNLIIKLVIFVNFAFPEPYFLSIERN